MADYAQLSTNIQKLKRAAIDAWMKQEGWELEGDHYFGPHGAEYEVTRPGENGEGGGDWSGEVFFQDWFVGGGKDREFSSRFNEIRGNIDSAMKRWLPNAIAIPEEFDPLIAAMKAANTKLALSASASGGSVTAGGSVAGNINGLEAATDKLSGSTIDAFRSKFVLQLPRVVGGEHALTVVLGGAIAAEKKAKNPPAPDYNGIMKGLTQALDDLDAAITSEEEALAKNLRENEEYVAGLKGTPESFDLSPALLDISDDSQAEIHVIQSVVDSITETYMPEIASSLDGAAKDVDGASSSLPWIRDDSVGYTNYGHWSDLYSLLWLLQELLKDLSWEVSSGARTMALVIEDIGVTDSDAQDALEKHHEKVKEGSGHDPFPAPAPRGPGNRPI